MKSCMHLFRQRLDHERREYALDLTRQTSHFTCSDGLQIESMAAYDQAWQDDLTKGMQALNQLVSNASIIMSNAKIRSRLSFTSPAP